MSGLDRYLRDVPGYDEHEEVMFLQPVRAKPVPAPGTGRRARVTYVRVIDPGDDYRRRYRGAGWLEVIEAEPRNGVFAVPYPSWPEISTADEIRQKGGTVSEFFTVYVPATEHPFPEYQEALAGIRKGSGIIGTPVRVTGCWIDYEGDLHEAQSLRTYADRCWMAAGRHRQGLPTRARMIVPMETLQEIGVLNFETGEIKVPTEAQAALTTWLGLSGIEVPATELLRTSVEVLDTA